MERTLMFLAAVNGFLAVALGAFGAHGLKTMLETAADGAQRLEWWETAARYHMYHALALGLLAYLAGRVSWGGLATGGWLMLAGIILFCGSLYVMTLTGMRALGAVTPLGGVAFLAGWVLLAVGALKLAKG
jgi:uncharacterized membrane protein YgdD (TMEM256/DUF423 family)